MFIPPPPLSREEFDRRVAAGARTFAEIDPEFMAALRSSQRFRLIMSAILALAAAGTIGFFVFFAWITS